jgi:hypothetical protein
MDKKLKYRDSKLVYRSFPTIDEANLYAEDNGVANDKIVLPLFAKDKPNPKNPGAKSFVVSGYEIFWKTYLNLKQTDRCFYETLLENEPCHLHFDLEFYRGTNKDTDETELDRIFESEAAELMIELDLVQTEDQVRPVVLVSSNEKKVSKHYIYKMSGACMVNNYHCGAFARRLDQRILNKYGSVGDGNPFYLWGEKETKFVNMYDKQSYMDLGIYTRRRQFRLYFSSKRTDPSRPLLLIDQHRQTQGYKNKEVIKEFTLNRDDFIDTLIQRVDHSLHGRVCEITELDGSEPISTSKKKNPLSSTTSKKRIAIITNASLVNDKDIHRDAREMQKAGTSVEIPDVCRKMEHMVEEHMKGRGQAKVKSYLPHKRIIVMGTNCHYCELKSKQLGVADSRHGGEGTGRTGNCIYFIVDMKNRKFWQRCHSINYRMCRGRTDKMEIPKEYQAYIDAYEEKISQRYVNELDVDSLTQLFNKVYEIIKYD